MPDHTGGPTTSEVEAGAAAKARSSGRKIVEGGSRWRLRNWRLRTKLIAVLLVPIITAIALGVLRAAGELDRASTFDDASTSITATLDVVALVHDLQGERNMVVAFVAGNRTGDTAPMQGQIQRTNASLNKLTQAAAASSTTNGELLAELAGRLGAVGAVRNAALSTASFYPDVAVYRAYSALLENVLAAGAEFTSTLAQSEISRLGATSLAIVQAKEFLSRQNAILLIASARGGFPAGMQEQARAAEASYNAAIGNFRANADPVEAQFFADTFSGFEVDDRARVVETALNNADQGKPLQIDGARLINDAKVTADSMRRVEISLLEKLRGRAQQSADDAAFNAWRDAAIVLLAILLALGVTVLVARSLLVPLRVLRRDALDVANRRLPETVQRILADPDPVEASKNAVDPVPVFTREETGQLARSFDAVHDQAVRMATEQALLRDNINSIFVNLSRRSQTLVERQLSLIDRLEQDEQDPDQLASLFELDHLATRMRRNSESLLVLSGSGLSRQLSRPVPAAEVVGAAVSEVEQYARIEVLSAPEISVQGRAVSDLVHLIAELLDNATSFSEPEKKVYVRMAMTRKKELAIQITDSGVGMTADEIEATNARLADPPDLDVAVTRRMGLYVVARLAKRHEIKVRLRDNEDIEGGLISRITVPAALVSTGAGGSVIQQTAGFGDTAVKASGIAGAFGGANRDRTPKAEGGILAESPVERSADDLAGFPAFEPQFGVRDSIEDTGGWGPPADPEEVSARLNGHGFDFSGTDISTFGRSAAQDPEPEPDRGPGVEDSGYDLFGSLPVSEPEPQERTDTDLNGHSTGFGRDGGFDAYAPFTRREDSPAPQPVDRGDLDAPTERLPIYEAVLSQWFEATDSGSTPHPLAGLDAPGGSGNGSGGSANGSTNGAHDPAANGDGGHPDPQDASDHYAEDEHRDAVDEVPEDAEAERISSARAAAWQSPGDDGWQRARALLDTTSDTMTTAGLPKRVPKAHLVPGSAAPREETAEQSAAAPPLPPRTADAVRGRMSSFQQGVRRGRHALVDAYPGDQTGSDESRQDEEQE
ncbi:nitrate- and nitrite sensing domain-containing protein [Actinokineospora sp. PR83]|uniref:sensor histidine kinase n=1 Tax=Actinokineospora sp. PR83 TaxID=2884908 RepID=UPI0027E19959|nr:nitrate- and nitrite sensing domain-containing protein [Actinokineospora sp. PR83]MCG8916745.1 nitrate- and nitrite sensing domain-containing protein [Actinokineospora sp. PR83]